MRLIALIGLLALAGTANATLITVDPGAFASGTDISHAYDGVSLSNWTYNATTKVEAFGSIYSVDCPGCAQNCASCSSVASTAFGWGPAQANTLYYGARLSGIEEFYSWSVVRADFAEATNYIEVIAGGGIGIGDPPIIKAFDINGNVIGRCASGVVVSNCSVELLTPDRPDQYTGLRRFAITVDSASIAYITAGGSDGSNRVWQVAYNSASVPEPETLSLAAFGLLATFVVGRRRRRQS